MTTTQEMFFMNMSANLGATQIGPGIEQKVYDKIFQFLAECKLSNWEIVWGPAVYVAKQRDFPDNVMFLAYDRNSPNSPRYFLSVAGTNRHSIVDWIEDLDTGTTNPWPWNNAGNEVQIANGSYDSLQILGILKANARVGGNPVGNPMLLTDYLKNEVSKAGVRPSSMITGGHSLGGALAPILALWLADTQQEWDPNKAISGFASWPSAGPTIGNMAFKEYYNLRIPNTTRIHNTLDVVPHAWNVTDLNMIPSLYERAIGKPDCIQGLVKLCIKKVTGIDYEQAGPIDNPLTGTINKSKINPILKPGTNFAIQLVYQHINAYFDLLEIKREQSFTQYFFDADIADWDADIAYWEGVAAGVKVAASASDQQA